MKKTSLLLLFVWVLQIPIFAQSKLILRSLQATTITEQVLDYRVTRQARELNSTEVNYVLNGIVDHPLLFATTKVVGTTAIILGSEVLWKRGKKKTALVLLAGIVGGYGAILASNYHQLAKAKN